jgi:hypothetical protein
MTSNGNTLISTFTLPENSLGLGIMSINVDDFNSCKITPDSPVAVEKKIERPDNMVQWIEMSDVVFSNSMLMRAESQMRNRVIGALSDWGGASTYVFGGSVRRSILSDHTIEYNKELQSRLADGSYHEYKLSPDHFLPLGTDLDVYITNPKNAHSCIQDLQVYMQKVLIGCKVVSCPADAFYVCSRMLVKTLPHPIAPIIRIKLDLVLEGIQCLFPDFSCNQVCVSTSTSSLGMFAPLGMDPWWTAKDTLEKCLQNSPCVPYTGSILGGKMDTTRRAIKGIKAQIAEKTGYVLLFSYRRWAQERRRMKRRTHLKNYSTYVQQIVSMRLPKLLADGFSIRGFHPKITDEGEFCCPEGGNATWIPKVQIGSSNVSPDVMPRPVAPEVHTGRGRGQGKGRGGGRGQGKGRGHGHGEYKHRDSDNDSDSDSDCDCDDDSDGEGDEDVMAYYWCDGCLEWHDIVTFLL